RQSTDGLDYRPTALADSGATIMVERQRRLLELQPIAAAYHRELSEARERLELRYRPAGARIGEAPPDLVSQQLKAAMSDARDEEIARGQTVVGPQRDDVEVWLEDHEARLFASQGQQRSAVLSLKLAELQYLADVTGEQPVLLLDDVMSELDPARRERLLAAPQPGPQALITAADRSDLPRSILERAAGEPGHPCPAGRPVTMIATGPPLTEAQGRAVAHLSGPLLLVAGAGTGKTRVLVERYRRLRQAGIPAERILLLTFTEKAARE